MWDYATISLLYITRLLYFFHNLKREMKADYKAGLTL